MTGHAPDGTPRRKERDPFLRFLAGCAIVVGALAAVVILVAGIAAWRLTRDPAPEGRPVETLRSADDTLYVCVDLKPDDKGVQELVDRFSEWNDANRRKALDRTFLKSLPLPSRRLQLSKFAPLRIELAAWPEDGSDASGQRVGWAARGTFSKGVYRMRFFYRVLRWTFERDRATTTQSVDGVPVTEVRGPRGGVALAVLDNRILIGGDGAQLRRILRAATAAGPPPDDGLDAAHAAVALRHEDAWSVVRGFTLGTPSRSIAVRRAVVSYDLDEDDGLAFRISADETAAQDGTPPAFAASPAAAMLLTGLLVPEVPLNEMEFEFLPGSPSPGSPFVFSGRVAHVSEHIGEWLHAAEGGGDAHDGGEEEAP